MLQGATVIATSKIFFYMFGINGNFVTTNGTNRIVIVPKAAWTFNHRRCKHIPILTMMTGFRGFYLNDLFEVGLTITFYIFKAFGLTLFRSGFLLVTTVVTVVVIINLVFVLSLFPFLINRSKYSCFLLNAYQLLTLPDHPGKY